LIRRKAALVYPVLPAPPTAVLVPWFRNCAAIRVFEQGWDARAAAYRPGAIAGTWVQMESLLKLKIDSVTHALLVLKHPGGDVLTVDQRQRLWNAFRVPVFEQIIGDNGLLLAAECEAHDGLHIESPKFEVAGLSIETAPCGCGRSTPRVKTVEPVEEVRSAAAHAG